MLGSAFEAEDAVQETMLRAWRNLSRYDPARASPRTWLFQIATNICLDMLKGARRRARAMDLGPASTLGSELGAPLPEQAWVQPVPDAMVLPAGGDPAEVAVARETVRLAFVAALQCLAPRQRAVLILRDVLRWSAAEAAGLLGTSVAAVNSALQRARAALPVAEPYQPMDAERRALLERYVAAFERYDLEALVATLHEDATMSMPPFSWWLRGREQIRAALIGSAGACEHSRLVPVQANGGPAFGQYDRHGQGFALVLAEVTDGLVSGITTYLAADRLFPLFGLPMSSPPPRRIPS